MREILFRGKSVDTWEWVFGAFLPDLREVIDGFRETGDDGFIKPYSRIKEERISREVDRETVGQYIGLTDTNGKKIFEGDIVTSTVEIGRFVVAYRPEIACYAGIRINNLQALPKWVFLYENAEKNLTVIGNMHDNPELMEVTEDDSH